MSGILTSTPIQWALFGLLGLAIHQWMHLQYDGKVTALWVRLFAEASYGVGFVAVVLAVWCTLAGVR